MYIVKDSFESLKADTWEERDLLSIDINLYQLCGYLRMLSQHNPLLIRQSQARALRISKSSNQYFASKRPNDYTFSKSENKKSMCV